MKTQDNTNDLYEIEFIQLFEVFLNCPPNHRENYLVSCIDNIPQISREYFNNQPNYKFSSKLHKFETKNNSEVANILEITCPNVKIAPLARTIYVCFNSDFTKFRYYTIEYHLNINNNEVSYLICEQTKEKHILHDKVLEDNEIEIISKLFLNEL